VTALAASLTLALALLLSGVSAALNNEVDRTVSSFHADGWLVLAGSSGPFSSPTPFSAAWAGRVAQLPGVRSASAVVIGVATTGGSQVRQVNVNGLSSGAAPRVGTVLADDSLGLSPGSDVTLNGVHLRVVGLLHGRTYFAGTPTVVTTLRDAQRILFNGLPLITAIVTRGTPGTVPRALSMLSNVQTREDLRRPVARATRTLSLIRILLWLIAAAIIGTFIYLSARERTRELAVLKAIGVTSRDLVLGLALQAVAVALSAAVLGIGLEAVFAPASELPVEVPTAGYLLLPLIAVGIGLVASAAAVRRALAIDPAHAFGGA
jgi:putative ABC transport system permease protein